MLKWFALFITHSNYLCHVQDIIILMVEAIIITAPFLVGLVFLVGIVYCFVKLEQQIKTESKNRGKLFTVEYKSGTVINLEKREKSYGALVENHNSWNAYQASIANRYEVWSFIIDCVDQDGNTLYYTSVYFKAREINGVLHDGDEVQVEGIYNKDTKILKPEVIFNKTGNSYIEIIWKNEFDISRGYFM